MVRTTRCIGSFFTSVTLLLKTMKNAREMAKARWQEWGSRGKKVHIFSARDAHAMTLIEWRPAVMRR
jgi:hypothetical protein